MKSQHLKKTVSRILGLTLSAVLPTVIVAGCAQTAEIDRPGAGGGQPNFGVADNSNEPDQSASRENPNQTDLPIDPTKPDVLPDKPAVEVPEEKPHTPAAPNPPAGPPAATAPPVEPPTPPPSPAPSVPVPQQPLKYVSETFAEGKG